MGDIMNSKLSALQIETVVKLCLLILSHSKRKYSMKTNNIKLVAREERTPRHKQNNPGAGTIRRW